MPGNREWAVESRWLLRGKQKTVLVMAVIGGRIEVLRIHGILPTKGLKSYKGIHSRFYLMEEKILMFLELGLVWSKTQKSFGGQTH